jgi:predicted HicB family RNase H-like nuclease
MPLSERGPLVTKQAAPRVTTNTSIGTDINLDREDVRLHSGRRLTPKAAEEIVEEVRRVGGRPSLSGVPMRSPQIAFRVPAEVRERAAQVAAAEGKTVSQLAREALEARLAGPPPA